jgi:hypothetical protein
MCMKKSRDRPEGLGHRSRLRFSVVAGSALLWHLAK